MHQAIQVLVTAGLGIESFRNEFYDCGHGVLRIFEFEQLVGSKLDHFGPFGMGKNVELLILDCLEDHVHDLLRAAWQLPMRL